MDHEPARKRQQGQVMVLFLLAIFAIIGMVGLVLDGGSVFAQRRDQQTAADLAAMAGAAAYLNATGTADQREAYAESVATSVAIANGYVEGTNGVDMAFTLSPARSLMRPSVTWPSRIATTSQRSSACRPGTLV